MISEVVYNNCGNFSPFPKSHPCHMILLSFSAEHLPLKSGHSYVRKIQNTVTIDVPYF